MIRKISIIAVTAAILVAAPLHAGNSLMASQQSVAVAKSPLSVTPDGEWNKLGARPGQNSESWTMDGDALNEVIFYGGIADGKKLFREVDKRNKPLPAFSATMLITDIPVLLENSYRTALGTPMMTIDSVEPHDFVGHKGVRFTYSFTHLNDDLKRKGEARAAIVNGALYMMTYEAPTLHYFDKDAARFRQLADSAKL